jgi:hypothetical protein
VCNLRPLPWEVTEKNIFMRKLFCAVTVCAAAWATGCTGDARPGQSQAAPSPTPSPTPSPSPSLGIQLRTDSAGLTPTRSALGTAVKLDGRFENAMIARRNTDGSVTVECHDDEQQAQAFLAAPGRDAHNREVQ